MTIENPSIVYFKDRFIEESECRISLRDRSFRFGDGIFETMLVVNGRIYDMPPHLERLKKGLSAFRLGLDISGLKEICEQVIRRNTLTQGYVRILVSRGVDEEGVVGYLTRGSVPYCVVQAFARPYPGFKPLNLWLSSYKVSFHTPSKTNNALLYTLAMLEASDNKCDNALLLDTEGNICETASGNIFWIKDSVLYTPDTALPFVPGTMRDKVIQLWDGEIKEGRFTLDDLKSAEEVFMTNIGTILAPVSAIGPSGLVLPAGARTKALRRMLDKEIKRAVYI